MPTSPLPIKGASTLALRKLSVQCNLNARYAAQKMTRVDTLPTEMD